MSTVERHRTWGFPNMRLRGHIAFGALMWAALVLVTLGIAIGFTVFSEVPGSRSLPLFGCFHPHRLTERWLASSLATW